MTKAELIELVAGKAGISKREAGDAVEAIIDGITGALKKGDKVNLVGFGTFSVSKRAARTGRNPATGATIRIAASKSPKFKAGKPLKEAVA